jgi:hypothetical protein
VPTRVWRTLSAFFLTAFFMCGTFGRWLSA